MTREINTSCVYFFGISSQGTSFSQHQLFILSRFTQINLLIKAAVLSFAVSHLCQLLLELKTGKNILKSIRDRTDSLNTYVQKSLLFGAAHTDRCLNMTLSCVGGRSGERIYIPIFYKQMCVWTLCSCFTVVSFCLLRQIIVSACCQEHLDGNMAAICSRQRLL